jgi:hypothetical protein
VGRHQPGQPGTDDDHIRREALARPRGRWRHRAHDTSPARAVSRQRDRSPFAELSSRPCVGARSVSPSNDKARRLPRPSVAR